MTQAALRSDVRRVGRAARQQITGVERERAEAKLLLHLRSLTALQAGTVGVFVAHDGEPDLSPLILWLRDRGQVVALPVLNDDPNDFAMRFVPWYRGDELGSGRYGIPIPPEQTSGPHAAIEPATLLVSLVGFDSIGNRMGRGAGFFDRYMATTNAAVVGVGFESQRFDALPVEPHDVPLPVVVTNAGVRYCESRRSKNNSE